MPARYLRHHGSSSTIVRKKKKAAKVKINSKVKKEPSSAKIKNGKNTPKVEAVVARRKGEKPEKADKRNGAAAVQSKDDKNNRIALLRQRHEAMKREIDQIREDLESDEED